MKKLHKQFSLKLLAFLLVLIALVYWKWWLPGPRVAHDFPLVSLPTLRSKATLPAVWKDSGSEGMGEYSVFTLWSWPSDFLAGFLGRLGLDIGVQERLVFIIPIVLIGIFAIWKLLSEIKLSSQAKLVSSFFFLINTYLILLIDGGQLSIGLVYSLFPLSFWLIKNSVNANLRKKIIAALSVLIIGFFDIRFIFILFLLSFIYFIYELIYLEKGKKADWIVKSFSTGAVVGLVFLFFNFYWLLPLFFNPISSQKLTSLTELSDISFATIGHSLTLLQPHWYKNVFGKVTNIRAEFLLIPALVFLAPILRKKSKSVGFWLIVALLSVFLGKGTNPPLANVYTWLFNNIPGLSLFRDSTKFFFLIALSYSVLIAISTDELVKRFNWKLKIGKWKITVIPILLITYFTLLVSPVWLGNMTGTFSEPVYKSEFLNVNNQTKDDKGFGRVFWIPSRAPLGYASPTHTSVEAQRLASERPFAIGTVGTYETFNFLREATFMGEIFDIAAIKCIVYPYPDARREDVKQDNIDYYYAFLDQLTNLNWIDQRIFDPPVALLKTKKNQDHFFIAENTWLVVGSDKIYEDLVRIPNFKLSDNAMIFVEEQFLTGNWPDLINQDPHIKILQYEKSMVDVMASLMPKEALIFPASLLKTDPDETGWWKRESGDFVWFRDFLQTKYGIDNQDFDYQGGYAFAEGSRKLQISNDKLLKGDVLLARVMKSTHGGKIEFWQGDKKVGNIDTRKDVPEKIQIRLAGYGGNPDQVFEYDKADFFWFEVGELMPGNQGLEIRTEGDINIVNVLVSVSGEEWFSSDSKPVYDVINWEALSQEEINELFGQDDSQS